MIRVLIVDDHTTFRDAVELRLEAEADMQVVGSVRTGAEARGIAAKEPVDVAIVDLGLVQEHGTELIMALRETNPEVAVLVVTGHEDRLEHARAVQAGAAGVLHKSVRLDEIVPPIRRVAAGELLPSPRELAELYRLMEQVRERDQASLAALRRLTVREREVLQAAGTGITDREIAAQMGVSEKTVHSHMARTLEKLGVHSRLQALLLAARHGIVKLE